MLKVIPKFWRDKQFSKQFLPMDAIEFGMESDINEEHP
jgi:hypothetical protein